MLQRYAGLQREADDKKIVLTLLRAVRASPEDVETKLVLGSHLLQKSSYLQAVVILEEVRNANAEQARTALSMLAYARLKLNHRESGQQAARQLLELARTPEEINHAQRLLALLERDPADISEGRPVSQDGLRDEFGEREARLIPDDTPVSPRRPQNLRPREVTSMVAGSFVRLDCLGDQARMDLAVGGETVSLLIEDGGRVDLKGSDAASVDLRCGEAEAAERHRSLSSLGEHRVGNTGCCPHHRIHWAGELKLRSPIERDLDTTPSRRPARNSSRARIRSSTSTTPRNSTARTRPVSGYIDLSWLGMLLVEQKCAGRDLSSALDQAGV